MENEESIKKIYGIDSLKNPVLCRKTFEPGTYLCRQGQPLDSILFLLSGEAKLFNDRENGRRILLAFYTAGGVLGDMEFLLDRREAVNSIQAIMPTECLCLPLESNRAQITASPAMLRALGRSVARKLDVTATTQTSNLLYPFDARLCSYISMAPGVYFTEPLTETSEILGISYRQLLREMKKLTEENILQKTESGYRILNRAELGRRGKEFYRPIEGLE